MKKSIEDLLQEVDGLKGSSSGARSIQLTETQKRILVRARSGDNPVGWERLIEWWKKEFDGPKNSKTLKSKYNEMVASGEVEKYEK